MKLINIQSVFVIIVIFLDISCRQCERRIGKEQHSRQNKTAQTYEDKRQQPSSVDILSAPIDVYELKKPYQKFSTFRILPYEEWKYYHQPELRKGFYGRYHLISECSVPELVGLLTVFNENNPGIWRFENKEDVLVELTVLNDEIIIHDLIQVGMDVKDVIASLGAPHYELHEFIFYKEGNTIATIEVLNGRVNRFKIGRYELSLADPVALDFLTRFKYLI